MATARGRWIAALLLLGVYILHSVDRFVIGVVVEPIRHEFHFTDTQIGAIGGLAHAIAYSAFVLPVGWLLDRTNRVRLLAAMLALWSAITMLGVFATGFLFLFLMRMGVGASESASSPGTQSLIASIFPVKQRASAMGFVFSGTAIGTGLVFAVGGPVAQHFGWRAVFLLAGLPGIVLAVAMWRLLEEPPRGAEGAQAEPPVPMRRAAATFFKSRPILLSSLGSTIAAMSVASIWIWITPILIREHGYSLAQAGLLVGMAAGVLKFASGLLSGFVGDWIAQGRLNRLWIVPSCALVLSVPTGFGIAYAPSPILAGVLVMVLGLTMGTHYAAPKTVIMSVAPDNMRGSISALEQLMVNLVGVALGPLLTGFISDRLGGQSVSLALAATLSINLLAAASFWLAARSIPDSNTRAQPTKDDVAGTAMAAEAAE